MSFIVEYSIVFLGKNERKRVGRCFILSWKQSAFLLLKTLECSTVFILFSEAGGNLKIEYAKPHG